MPIDDQLEKTLAYLSEELDTNIPKIALATVISKVPYVGDEINKLLFGDAQKRVNERAKEVFEAVKERIEQIEESEIDKEFFKSDEFLTILLLAIEQLQTTHDKQKLDMLASAIANSGTVRFSSDSRKELFVRALRDLAPEHVVLLHQMYSKAGAVGRVPTWVQITNPNGGTLALLQTLVALGLVEEGQEKRTASVDIDSIRTSYDIKKAIDELTSLPDRTFTLSDFGADFLKYFEPVPPRKSDPEMDSP